MTEAVSTTRQQSATIKDLVTSDKFKTQVAAALPKHLTADRFIRVACTTLMRQPKLADCDQASFFNALLTLSQLGIEPDGRRAHLIPFENRKRGVTEVQLIIDYKGLAELAMRSGEVSNIHADVVCDNDEFLYDRGEVVTHKIDFRKDRGEVFAAYAICTFKDGTKKAEVMGRKEIEAIRSRSRAGQSGPWVTDWNEMAKKTCFRRLSKWLPLSPEYREAMDHDADALPDAELPDITVPRPLRRADVTVSDAPQPTDQPPATEDRPKRTRKPAAAQAEPPTDPPPPREPAEPSEPPQNTMTADELVAQIAKLEAVLPNGPKRRAREAVGANMATDIATLDPAALDQLYSLLLLEVG